MARGAGLEMVTVSSLQRKKQKDAEPGSRRWQELMDQVRDRVAPGGHGASVMRLSEKSGDSEQAWLRDSEASNCCQSKERMSRSRSGSDPGRHQSIDRAELARERHLGEE